MTKTTAAVLVAIATLTLAGCGDSQAEEIAKRSSAKEACEAYGGEWREFKSAWDGSMQGDCWLDTEADS